MTTWLDKLTRIVPPPETPSMATGDWNEVESMLGTQLPRDYKDFIHLYGSGDFNRAVWVYNALDFVELLRGTSPVIPAAFGPTDLLPPFRFHSD